MKIQIQYNDTNSIEVEIGGLPKFTKQRIINIVLGGIALSVPVILVIASFLFTNQELGW